MKVFVRQQTMMQHAQGLAARPPVRNNLEVERRIILLTSFRSADNPFYNVATPLLRFRAAPAMNRAASFVTVSIRTILTCEISYKFETIP